VGHPVRFRDAAALAAAVVALAACGAAPARRPAPTPHATARATATPTPTRPRPTPTASATIPAGIQLTDVSFVSPTLGFALGENCRAAQSCLAVTLATADGGGHWRAAPAPVAAVGSTSVSAVPGESADSVSRITFANPQDGWLWGPGLFATSDGAATWTRVATTGPVLALAAVGADVWAVQADCGGAGAGGACPLVLESAPLGGGSWSPVAGLPSVDGMAAALTATGGGDAWIEAVVPTAGGSGTALLIYATADGGSTWVRRADPCPTPPAGSADPLAAYGSATVWLGCVGQEAAGSQAKAIYTSADGGSSWTLAGSSGPSAAGVPAAQGRVPAGGYLDQLALTGPGVGWMALGRGTLVVSRDGGRSWTPAIAAGAVAAGSGILRVTFVAGSGWAIANGVSLPGGSAAAVVYRTGDGGGSWSPVPIG